jgi:hypothetical protein
MTRRRICRCVARFASRIAVALSAFGIVLMSLGVSGGSVRHKDRSTPFPCMFSRCSCETAADCWRSCCCHSVAERIAWARKRNIEPPREVLAKAAKIEAVERRACCSKEGSPDREIQCCAKTSGCDKRPIGDTLTQRREAGVVAVDAAPSCSGPGDTGTGLRPGTTVVCTSFDVHLDPCGWCDYPHERFYSAAARPLEKPPRASV